MLSRRRWLYFIFRKRKGAKGWPFYEYLRKDLGWTTYSHGDDVMRFETKRQAEAVIDTYELERARIGLR
jgi:hypothetical protein